MLVCGYSNGQGRVHYMLVNDVASAQAKEIGPWKLVSRATHIPMVGTKGKGSRPST